MNKAVKTKSLYPLRLLYDQAEHFGIENRMLQCTEECGELIQALSKYKRALQGDITCTVSEREAIKQLIEEVADVEITLKQIKFLLCITEEVEHIKADKIIRTEQRLNI